MYFFIRIVICYLTISLIWISNICNDNFFLKNAYFTYNCFKSNQDMNLTFSAVGTQFDTTDGHQNVQGTQRSVLNSRSCIFICSYKSIIYWIKYRWGHSVQDILIVKLRILWGSTMKIYTIISFIKRTYM